MKVLKFSFYPLFYFLAFILLEYIRGQYVGTIVAIGAGYSKYHFPFPVADCNVKDFCKLNLCCFLSSLFFFLVTYVIYLWFLNKKKIRAAGEIMAATLVSTILVVILGQVVGTVLFILRLILYKFGLSFYFCFC